MHIFVSTIMYAVHTAFLTLDVDHLNVPFTKREYGKLTDFWDRYFPAQNYHLIYLAWVD